MPNCEKLFLTFCPEDDSILISEGTVEALGRPQHMQMMLNEESNMILLRGCQGDDDQAFDVPEIKNHQFEQFAWALTRRLRKRLKWKDGQPRLVAGKYIEDQQVVVFSLEEAQPVRLQTFVAEG